MDISYGRHLLEIFRPLDRDNSSEQIPNDPINISAIHRLHREGRVEHLIKVKINENILKMYLKAIIS